ncbi:MAG: hypothetical protein ACRYG4_16880 [Janthinobacterium lividum]
MPTFYHYTTSEGHDAIMHSLRLLPSVLEGKEHTHYGKGIYFGTLDPHFDAQFLGISEFASTLFNQLSNANLSKFFYYVEIGFSDGRDCLPLPVSDNRYLYLLETLDALELSLAPPQPGRVQVVSHGLTYWGQLKELGVSSKQDLQNEPPGWKPKETKHKDNRSTDPNWAYSPWNIDSKY